VALEQLRQRFFFGHGSHPLISSRHWGDEREPPGVTGIWPDTRRSVMEARMKNPVMILPGVLQSMLAIDKATETDSLPFVTRKLVHLRASQINGCSVCVDMHSR